MARLPRLHVPGALYYILLRGNGGQPIFFGPQDWTEFSRLVALAVQRSHTRVHAFCWMKNQVRLAVQIADQPVGRLVQRIAGQHARGIHRRLHRTGHLFERGYHALLVDGSRYLPELVRHIHLTPVRAGLVRDAAEYSWSGHRAYLQLENIRWLTTHAVLKSLAQPAMEASAAYRAFMLEGDEQEDAVRFAQGSSREPRVLGDERFLASLPLKSRPNRRGGSLDQLIERVTTLLEISRADLLSASRRRRLSLARAVVAWHATHHNIARLIDVAQRLHRDPSTLLAAIERYRELRPELFAESMALLADREAESWRLLMRPV